ncbi:MAG: hypothetical protein CL840_21340 [Crocinitomicaceae bacterium]|nr:hypothetical protein [Crocinitomicaceae bacterium]|tara:strand:- start:34445 stop:35473 length:1029 start_codon:yes stop_codon:yes gene_type:complete
MKRIVICFDGTWNRPERLGEKDDYPTNVLKFARGIAPTDGGTKQVVFYDWGIGSYHAGATGGGFGKGLEKNVMDGYRFLVHNYEPNDQIYLFGFSRGAYTARSLCGMINNCSILKSSHANMIEEAFELYKNPDHSANGDYSINWKTQNSVETQTKVHFVGVWDTVGSMGVPFSFLGFLNRKHAFYDHKIGSNISFARHALALDEIRNDFYPTIWEPKDGVDLKQVWFAGAHSDIGGGYPPDEADKSRLSDISMKWMKKEAFDKGLKFDTDFGNVQLNPNSHLNDSYSGMIKLLGKKQREIPDPAKIPTLLHQSVADRIQQGYKNKTLKKFEKKYGRLPDIEQ